MAIISKKAQAPKRQGLDNDVDLYGNIESVTFFSYHLHKTANGIVKGNMQGRTTYKLNGKGDVSEITHYDHVGELIKKTIFRYNESQKISERLTYHSNGELWGKDIFLYDDRKNISCKMSYHSDGFLTQKTLYRYDCNDNLKEKYEIEYLDADQPLCTEKYKYDYNGNEIEHSYYGMNDRLEWKHSYIIIYNSNEQKEEEIKIEDGTLQGRWLYKYDSLGNEIERAYHNTMGIVEYKNISKYDNKGNRIEYITYNGKNSITNKITTSYDINGNLVQEIDDYSIIEGEIIYRC